MDSEKLMLIDGGQMTDSRISDRHPADTSGGLASAGYRVGSRISTSQLAVRHPRLLKVGEFELPIVIIDCLLSFPYRKPELYCCLNCSHFCTFHFIFSILRDKTVGLFMKDCWFG